ncbi:MAG: sigma-54-dependent Fis family transcriptional regulator [Desulfobacteraceae bacterium]|nr:sigma-54-dependent Fis family transcriptional regulator [Desulfobacteraceae bacterium]
MPSQRVLIILESPKKRIKYTKLVENFGFMVDALPDGSNAELILQQNEPDMVIADTCTPQFFPFEFLKTINKSDTPCKVLFISSEPVVEDAIELMKQGAVDYLIDPVQAEQIEFYLQKIIQKKDTPSSKEKKGGVSQDKVAIITHDKEMKRLLKLAEKIADSSASVLIQGESGTGKELFARFIHEKSDRRHMPFVAINCAALPEALLESELFGHEKGAFTGAISRKAGKFELAHTGTLLLDEISEMQVHLQAKLLRVLQEKKVDRVGGTKPLDVDVRIVATTNREIETAIKDGEFREDLYYRLNTIPLLIPPLRDRQKDLDPLCAYFMEKYCKIDRRNVKGMTKEAFIRLASERFSGNVRELENIIHRAVLLTDDGQIKPGDLLLKSGGPIDIPLNDNINSSGNAAHKTLKDMEKKLIFHTLTETGGNRTNAAKILGISVRTLRNKLNEYKKIKNI